MLLPKSRRRPQRRLSLLSPQKRNRKLQAGIDPATSKQLHSPLPVKGLPPNPKPANASQDEQNSQTNSSAPDADLPVYGLEGYVMVGLPTPPPPVVPAPKGKELPTSPPVPTPRMIPIRSNSNEPTRHRPNSPRNPKDQRRTGEELVLELSRREEERARMVQYIEKVHERMTSMEGEITALNTALSDTEHALHSTRQDLSASRAFVSSEGSVDGQLLIKMMRDLNGSIDDFAYQLLQVIPEASLTRKVSRSGLETLGKSFEHARKITTFISLAYKNSVTIGDFIQPLVQYALCMRLYEVIFTPWVPGMPREKSEIFHNIYTLVHQREAQVSITIVVSCHGY